MKAEEKKVEARTIQAPEAKPQLKPGSNYLGRIHHPAIGIRIPELFLPGIIASLQKHHCAASLMLSFGRETAPEEIINAPPGRYEITLGHTGTPIRKYLIAGARAARSAGIPVEMEADHLIVTESSAIAVKRIEGVKTPKFVGPAAIEKSIQYNIQAVEEAVSTGVVRAFTVDTSDLFDHEAEKLSSYALRKRFNEAYPPEERQRLFNAYAGRHGLKGGDGRPVRVELSRERVMRICLKFKHSLEVTKRLYQEIASRTRHPFAFEISMDETEKATSPAEALVYLGEWNHLGLPCDYLAPNVGFEKRRDYRGNLQTLKNRVRALHAVAGRFGALLSFHSGSGDSPWSGKGKGVYETILEATGSCFKYKVSGVYFELLMEILANYKKGTDPRILFELIYDELLEFLEKELETNGPLASDVLARQWEEHKAGKKSYDPRSDLFRFHSFLVLNFRDPKGRRYFRERIVRLYNDDFKFKKSVDNEVEALTTRLIEGLKFANNY